jgi:hypothetical protein
MNSLSSVLDLQAFMAGGSRSSILERYSINKRLLWR